MVLPRVLRAAARRVAANERGAASSTDASDELAGVLASIVQQVRAGPRARIDRRLRSPLGRRLLERLRTAVIHLAREGGDEPAAAIAILAAIERVGQAIGSGATRQLGPRPVRFTGLELLTAVADHVRSPLSSILFLAETLRREQSGPLNDVQRRQLGLIYGAALALSSIASDMMELARQDDALIGPEPTPFSLSAMLESVRDIVRPVADERQVAVRLASPSIDCRLGHPVALSRVLLNLTANALRSTSEGYIEIVVQEIGADRLGFSVRDSGSVIGSEEMLRHLYHPLRRAPDRTLTFSQSGLGLALCRKLVKVLGSELAVEMGCDWGTRFYFQLTLPRAKLA